MVECSTLHELMTLLAVLRLGFQYLGLIAELKHHTEPGGLSPSESPPRRWTGRL